MNREIVLDRVMLKVGVILVGIILICSLIGIGAGGFIPAEKTKEVVAAKYNHEGKFTYKGYSASNLFSGETAQPNPTLFPQIIEEMEILFSSSGIEGDTEIKLILEDKGGNWQKEIPIKITGSSPVSFPLDLKEIILRGAIINAELKGEALGELTEELEKKLLQGSPGFLLKIIAEAGTGKDLFAMTLEGDLSSTALKWKEEGFNKIERGFPGGDNWRQGAFGYRVKLKENELFEQTTLERKPELWKTSPVSPDFSLFTGLVESLDLSFNYQFKSDVRINSLEEETNVWMVMEEPGRWKKSFTLLPPTKKQAEFTLNFPLDIDKLGEIAGDINKEIGGKGGKEQEITIFAQVHTIAKTNAGIIDEVFDQQLKGKIGEKIEWPVVEKDLTLTKEGTITKKVVEPNPLRKFSLIGFGVSFPIFCALAFLYWRKRQKPSFLEEELKKNRKKYKELISEVTDFPPAREGEATIDASSLEALVNISNNSLKPILLRVEPKKHTYWVVDGLTRYRYVVEEG